MGLGIYASTGITLMHTYVTTREVKLLYFDGQSAVLSTYGTLDSQTALLRQHVLKEPGNEFIYNETARGHELCALAHDMHVDGIMRMDAGFEVLICDFEKSHLVESHAVNVTVPGRGSYREDDSKLPRDPARSPLTVSETCMRLTTAGSRFVTAPSTMADTVRSQETIQNPE